MKEQIQSIIDTIPKGTIFDAHTIIEKLIQKYSDAYLEGFKSTKFKADESFTATERYHAHISMIISSCKKIKKLEKDSWSQNIHNNYDKCSCWEKQ